MRVVTVRPSEFRGSVAASFAGGLSMDEEVGAPVSLGAGADKRLLDIAASLLLGIAGVWRALRGVCQFLPTQTGQNQTSGT
jgi:hypothetical protein